MPIFDSTLLRIELDGECIRMRTYSRRHPSHRYHLLFRIDLETFLAGEPGSLLDSDNGSYLRCWKTDRNMLHFKFSWMDSTYRDDGSFTGWHDHVEVPLYAIYEMLSTGDGKYRFLHIGRREPAQFDFTKSQHVIAGIVEDKRRKRAFSKGMRDNHAHQEGVFRMYGDFVKHSFYFIAERRGQREYNGGYILSMMRKHTPIGTVEVPVYQRHT